ncbi:MAG TPA: parallel beta-helix domain-containing protein [Thermoanaerobaculia bacterium]|nr:parallel beta-helix domain-containing protein [Thermoanaerobaculia bacterium]
MLRTERVRGRCPKPVALAPIALALAALALASGCAPRELSPEELAKQLQTRLIEAQPGDVIEIPEGTYELTRSLSLTVDGVTIRGAGMDKTVLSFANQTQGAEGLLVSASDFTIEDLAIEDTRGDALKVNEGENIVLRRVRAEWTRGPSTENGSYGLYPVQTENVLIEECVAIAASDAGIYVGQSKNVVVRNNRAEYNVAGIEIENTVGADVYGNVVTHNTGGILVFNMPDLPQEGHSTRVFDNRIVANNTENFAPEGTAVRSVLAGSGVVITANDRVEVFGNRIADNQTANIVIASNYSTGYADREAVAGYDPYPETIYIYGNEFEGGGEAPAMAELEQLRVAMFGEEGRLPDVLWDGFLDAAKAAADGSAAGAAICVDNGEAVLLNVDAPNQFQSPSVDMAPHTCSHEKLPAITLAGIT